MNTENVDPQTDQSVFLSEPRAVDAGEGINWISQAWAIVKEKLGMWVLINLIMFAFIIVISMIPFVNFFISFIIPILIGGIIAICEKQRRTGEVELGLLFAGFQQKFRALFAVGAVSFAVTVVGFIISAMIGGSVLMAVFLEAAQYDTISPEQLMSLGSTLIYIYIVMGLTSIIAMALTWFAPALIINHNYTVGSAVSASLKAVTKNILPGLLFFIMMTIIMIIAAIPLFLGLLITMPLMLVTYYSTYRSLFFTLAENQDSKPSLQKNTIIE